MNWTLIEIRELMKDPHQRLAVSLHEAAHVHYGVEAGAIDVEYHGPHEYPGKPGVFGGAGIRLIFGQLTKVNLLKKARWLCAGSVVKRILAPRYWVEDEDETDYEVFLNDCTSKYGVTEQQAKAFWRQAQQDVERDLRSPEFRRRMWARAREVESKIPWDEDGAPSHPQEVHLE